MFDVIGYFAPENRKDLLYQPLHLSRAIELAKDSIQDDIYDGAIVIDRATNRCVFSIGQNT